MTILFAVVFYAKNVKSVTNVIIDGNEIYNCKTYTSETVTLNRKRGWFQSV